MVIGLATVALILGFVMVSRARTAARPTPTLTSSPVATIQESTPGTNRAPHESTDAHSHTARHQSTDAHLHTARHQSTDAHLHGKTAPHQKGIHANADGYAYADSHPDGDSFTDSHSEAQRSCPWDSPAMTPGKSASSFRLQAVKVITSCNWNPQISQEHTPVLRIRQ